MEKQILKLNTPLTVDEIDFRVQSINKGGYATILAYKDARVDMNRLDEVYGIDKWQKKYDIINGSLFCSVGIYSDELKQWVWKQDVGTESMTEKEKGQASDAFKRACFNFGIGRELYEYPVISVKLNADEFKIEQFNGKDIAKQTYSLKLKEWKWRSEFTNGKLTLLQAIDNNGKLRFSYPEKTIDNIPVPEKKAKGKKYMNENSPEFEKAVLYLKGEGTIEKIKEKYMLSETVEQLLINKAMEEAA